MIHNELMTVTYLHGISGTLIPLDTFQGWNELALHKLG